MIVGERVSLVNAATGTVYVLPYANHMVFKDRSKKYCLFVDAEVRTMLILTRHGFFSSVHSLHDVWRVMYELQQ